MMGSMACLNEDNSPTRISRLISSPTAEEDRHQYIVDEPHQCQRMPAVIEQVEIAYLQTDFVCPQILISFTPRRICDKDSSQCRYHQQHTSVYVETQDVHEGEMEQLFLGFLCHSTMKVIIKLETEGPSVRRIFCLTHQSSFNTARKAFCGTSTVPICFIRFLPRFCFSNSLRLRLTSPP